MNAEAHFYVRVLLIADATECTVSAPATIYASRYGLNPTAHSALPGAKPLETPVTVTLGGDQLALGTTTNQGRETVLTTDAPHVLTLNDHQYRGKLRLVVNADGRTFRVINLVPLEPYLAGVVGAEMPSYWEPEALKAQTIAARTYCLYTKNRFGQNRSWDVKSTQASQVYRGVEAESTRIWNAVTSTYGQVMVWPQAPSEKPDLFPAYYSAICGGYTEDCNNVFGERFGPLQQVPCPYCEDVAKLGLFFWTMAQFDRDEVTYRLVEKYPILASLGEIQDITAVRKSDHGQFERVTKVRLTGSTGKAHLLGAEDLRLSVDPSGRKIQSTMCSIEPWGNGWAFLSGRGWGHGVGMCQCGAEGMARLGKKTQEILEHYYPGSEITSLY